MGMLGISSNLSGTIMNMERRISNIPKMREEASRRLATEALSYMKTSPPMKLDGSGSGIPVKTANLKRNHSLRMEGHEACIVCPVYYWIYVVFGTKSMAPRDYRVKALEHLRDSGIYNQIMKDVAMKYMK